jgi:RNA polymerase I-specific transcription initiation factor RRN3
MAAAASRGGAAAASAAGGGGGGGGGGDSELALAHSLQLFVNAALQGRLEGDGRKYFQLVEHVSRAHEPRAQGRWFAALRTRVSLLHDANDARAQPLAKALFAFNWFVGAQPEGEACCESYAELLCSLVSANGTYLPLALRALVRPLSAAPPDLREEDVAKVHEMLHATLSRLLRLVPAATTSLGAAIRECFPHRRVDALQQKLYVKNLLRISEYAPSLRDRVLTAVMQHLVQLDAEVHYATLKGDLLAAAEAKAAAAATAMAVGDDGGDAHSHAHALSHAASRNVEAARKLDAVMSLLLQYLSLLRHSRQRDHVFASLLRVFEDCVLRTHRSRVGQFLLFFFCSMHNKYSEAFLRRLVEKAFERDAAVLERANAAACLAGFVSRAAFLRHASVTFVLDMLLQWAHTFIGLFEQEHGGPVSDAEARSQAHFYCVVQAILIIFSRRAARLAELARVAPAQLLAMRIDRLVLNALSPLRYCDPRVVARFLRACERLALPQWARWLRGATRRASAPTVVADGVMLRHLRATNSPHRRGSDASAAAAAAAAALPSSAAAATALGGLGAGSAAPPDWTLEDSAPFDSYPLPESAAVLLTPALFVRYRGDLSPEERLAAGLPPLAPAAAAAAAAAAAPAAAAAGSDADDADDPLLPAGDAGGAWQRIDVRSAAGAGLEDEEAEAEAEAAAGGEEEEEIDEDEEQQVEGDDGDEEEEDDEEDGMMSKAAVAAGAAGAAAAAAAADDEEEDGAAQSRAQQTRSRPMRIAGKRLSRSDAAMDEEEEEDGGGGGGVSRGSSSGKASPRRRKLAALRAPLSPSLSPSLSPTLSPARAANRASPLGPGGRPPAMADLSLSLAEDRPLPQPPRGRMSLGSSPRT